MGLNFRKQVYLHVICPQNVPIVHKHTFDLVPGIIFHWIVPMPEAFGRNPKERRTKSLLQIPRIQWSSASTLHPHTITICVKPIHPEHPKTKLYTANSTCQLVTDGETFIPSPPVLGLLRKYVKLSSFFVVVNSVLLNISLGIHNCAGQAV